MARLLIRIAACVLGAALAMGSASVVSARVIGMTVADVSSGDYTLTSVSVDRGPAGIFTYLPHQLTGVTLTDVDASWTPLLVSRGAPVPPVGSRASVLEDWRVDTAITEVTSTNGSADRSMEVTFTRPVINSDGPDILFFEFGGNEPIRWWINNDRDNQSAIVQTSAYSSVLMQGIPYTQYAYNNNGDRAIDSLEKLETTTVGWSSGTNGSGGLFALSLDLSTLGVPLHGSVTSIRFQTQAVAGSSARVDPALIVGLPAVPEPAGIALIGLAATALGCRRRA